MVLPVGRALTTGRAAVWWGGSQDSASLRSEDGTALIPKFSLILLESNAWDAHKSHKGKTPVFLPLLHLVGKASAHVRMVQYNLGNEAEQWLCFFIHMMKNTVHKRTLSQSMHGEGEAYKHLKMMRKAENSCFTVWAKHCWPQIIGKTEQRNRKYPLWDKRKKEEVTKQI